MKALWPLMLIILTVVAGQAQTVPNSKDSLDLYGIAYKHALEDSLLKYEKIKTAHHQLSIVHELQLEENNLLKKEMQLKGLQIQITEQVYQRRLEEQTKTIGKQFLKGFKIGAIAGVALVVGVRLITK